MGNSSSICADKKLKYFSNSNGSNNTSKGGAELLSVINSPRQETEYKIERTTADILTQNSGIIITKDIENYNSQHNNITHALSDKNYINTNTNIIGKMPKGIDCENLCTQNVYDYKNVNNLKQLNETVRSSEKIKGGNFNYTMDNGSGHEKLANYSNKIIFGYLTGKQCLRNGNVNKGLCFNIEERQLLGIHGLLPAAVKTEEQELEQCTMLLNRYENDLDKYIFLISLLDRNERLFYRLLASDISKMMPLVYTPTVGEACQKYSLIYQYPKGLFITIHDKGHIYDILNNWPEDDVRAIVVTDGERILGLGDLGANGMGIPVGKLALYTALAGVKPNQCLPITLDVGTNTESILSDPLYIGCRHTRVEGKEYDEFIDEFMVAAVKRFGQNCLIQFEDFANKNAFRLLEKYRHNYCTFNDDIQGTAAVAVAGIISSLRLTNTKLSDNRILFYGAGEAALGIASLALMGIQSENILEEQEARECIWLVDSKGLIVNNRPKGGITGHKIEWAHEYEPIDNLYDVIKKIRPTILIGAAAQPKAFSKEIITLMAEINEKPVIFALSNPTAKAECTAEEAYTHSNGRCIFASGSPFPPVTVEGRTFEPGQGNNSYVFPGIGLAVICSGAHTIPEEMFLLTAKTLATIVDESDLAVGRLYPKLATIKDVSIKIATVLVEYAYKNKLATVRPEPNDIETFIRSQMYNVNYQPALPNVYPWPKL